MGSAVLCSNFVKDAVLMAEKEGFRNLLFVGHIGKLIKVSAGVKNTHSKYGDGRMEQMAVLTRELGHRNLQGMGRACNTTDDALALLKEQGLAKPLLCRTARYVKIGLKPGVVEESLRKPSLFPRRISCLARQRTGRNCLMPGRRHPDRATCKRWNGREHSWPMKGLVMKLAVISFTRAGEGVCEKLTNAMTAAGVECCGYTGRKTGTAALTLQAVSGSLSEWTGQQFACCDGLIFIGAAGIAVRLIAPYLKDKLTDPAVVVVDEAGQFSISLLSGHVGGANRWQNGPRKFLKAVPVVTTASDVRGRTGIDVWAADHGFAITDRTLAKEIAAALLEGRENWVFQ